MCSPEVAKVVNERIQREGLPGVSRRGFLKLGGVAAAGAAASSLSMTVAAKSALAHGVAEIVDLSHVLSPDFPVFPGFNQAVVETLVTVKDNGFYSQQWTFGEHTGTHMDFPGHFIADGQLVDQYDVNLLTGAAVVIDISAKVADNPDTTVDLADLEAWESANGEIPEGAFVLMYSGWEAKLAEAGAYVNQGEEGMKFPGFSKEAVEFLVNERSIHGIGVDTLSLDPGSSSTFDAHYTILGAGLLGIENLANLTAIMGKSTTIICGIPKFANGSGGPARVLALISEA